MGDIFKFQNTFLKKKIIYFSISYDDKKIPNKRSMNSYVTQHNHQYHRNSNNFSGENLISINI